MAEWVEQFENHAVYQQLQMLKDVLDAVEQEINEEPLPQATEAIERLRLIAGQTEKALSSLDPFLAPIGVLNNVSSYVQQAVAYCNQFQADRNIAQLENANNQADAVLVQLASLLPVRSPEELEGMSEGIASFRRSVGQYHRYVNDERVGLAAQIEGAKQELSRLNDSIKTQQSRVDEVVNDLQRQFSESEERRRTEFAESEKDQENRFRKRQEEQTAEFNNFTEEQRAVSEDHLGQIAAHRKRAEELIHVIANTGMVGGYQKIANDERRVAFRWQVVAVVSFLGLIGFAVFAFVATLGGSVSWQAFSARVFVAVAFGILAAYAARQADRHEAVEKSSRRLELALASIDPYLVSLPEDKQHEVKQELAMRFFGELPEVDQKTDGVNGTSADLLRTALQTISDLAKKPPGTP